MEMLMLTKCDNYFIVTFFSLKKSLAKVKQDLVGVDPFRSPIRSVT